MKKITKYGIVFSSISLCLCCSVTAKTLIDYFEPTPIINELNDRLWGTPGVVPRDQDNGLEDRENSTYNYWDGKILKSKNGRYYMFGCRWDQRGGHFDWAKSKAIYAVGDNLYGPYEDQGYIYTDHESIGHNVTALALNDGRYALLVCETRPAAIYLADSLDGPWMFSGEIAVDWNGHEFDRQLNSNWSICERPDGSFLAVSRPGYILLSTNGITGPYKMMTDCIWPHIEGLDNAKAEDPVMWYSGGKYHVTVNWWDARQARHLVSDDGLQNWRDAGIAYDPEADFIRYVDGTINHWFKIERPNVVINADGHVEAFTFSVTDIAKWEDKGDDNHGSKVIVVPFDGSQFDLDNSKN
jgi:hypothetical protein